MIQQIRKENPYTLVIDGGDTIQAKRDYAEKRAPIVLQGMKMMGYDVINIGEGEFDFGYDFFNTQRKKWGLDFVSANIEFKEKETREAVKSWIMEERGGIRIGVTGIMSKIFVKDEVLLDKRISFLDPLTSLKKVIEEMRGKKTDITILISHLGYEATKNFLIDNPHLGLDVVVVSHGRQILEKPERINNTLMVQCSMGGEYLNTLTLAIESRNNKITGYTHKVIALTLTDDIPEDAELKQIMEAFVAEKYEENGRIRTDESEEKERKAHAELLKMSPEEFIKLMQKENEEKMKTGQSEPAMVPLK